MLVFIILVVLPSFGLGEVRLCYRPVHNVCQAPDMSPFEYVPGNEKELQFFCSSTNDYVECLHSYDLACQGRSEFNGLSPPLYYQRIRNLLDEACDESSALYHTLARSLPCIKSRIQRKDRICSKTTNKVIKAYDDYLDRLPNCGVKCTSEKSLRLLCLQEVTTAACVIDDINNECGFKAYEAARNVILQSQVVADKCYIHIFDELREVIDDLKIDANTKAILKDTFVVEIY